MKSNVPVLQKISAANDMQADALRQTFRDKGILVINIVASPGAGKTALLEKTIEQARDRFRMMVIEGDPATSLDGQRVQEAGASAVQINTGGGCHLEARMILQIMDHIDLEACDLIVIENVGNLLCPAGWDLGHDIQVVVASLPEGDDKPLKYPLAFSSAQVAVINKIDLEPHTPANVANMRSNALKVNGELTVFEVSSLSGDGMDSWVDWIEQQIKLKRDGALIDAQKQHLLV